MFARTPDKGKSHLTSTYVPTFARPGRCCVLDPAGACLLHSILNVDTFDDDQDRASADYIELSLAGSSPGWRQNCQKCTKRI